MTTSPPTEKGISMSKNQSLKPLTKAQKNRIHTLANSTEDTHTYPIKDDFGDLLIRHGDHKSILATRNYI